MTPSPRVLMAVGVDAAVSRTPGPKRDYAQVSALVNADMIDLGAIERSAAARLIRFMFGSAPALAWLSFARRAGYDVIVTDGEHVGIPLALLLRCSRSPVRHITIGHRLSARKKRPFFRVLRAHARMDLIAVHARRQYGIAIDELGIEPGRLALVPYQVDTAFFQPRPVPEERLIVSAGLEFRDYATLFRAVEGLGADVVVAAASRWSRHKLATLAPPKNVRIDSLDYEALRALYARAALVVVPLADVDNQAGVTTILEAMAMGKAVIVSQSLGQTDVIEDRRTSGRGKLRPRTASFSRALAAPSGTAVQATGFYVAPGDPDELRRAIDFLLAHPVERLRLGEAGRHVAQSLFTVEQFGERMRDLITRAHRMADDAPLRSEVGRSQA